MEIFLEKIAVTLSGRYGNTLNRHCIVFPNRRAGLFFLKYLSQNIDKPVWEPGIMTINDLFRAHSNLQVAGNEHLLMELYKVYRKHKKNAESFDSFIYWGDILLNDFDDIDKYLADAERLFRNISDIKEIENEFESLDDRQKEIIKTFWLNFNPEKPTHEKEGFISVWTILNDVYSEFRKVLRDAGFAYEGMIFRDIALDTKELFLADGRWDKFHFVGFNALNECEKRVMLRLQQNDLANFYWDYDVAYINIQGYNSAGYFLRENLKLFGNDMPDDWSYDSLLKRKKEKKTPRIIDTSSDVSQVKLVPQILRDFNFEPDVNAHETAVVLADENLLIPVLSTLPDETGDVNITMGMPLSRTVIYALLRKLMDLQMNSTSSGGKNYFRYADVINLLSDRLITELLCIDAEKVQSEIKDFSGSVVEEQALQHDGNYSMLFRRMPVSSQLSGYFRDILTMIASEADISGNQSGTRNTYNKVINEFLYRTVLTINRLDNMFEGNDISFSEKTYMLILDRMIRKQSVPFAGEPLSGIQIMGILETRALDFRNLIVLSVNEGIIPAVSSPSSSFIPFNMREAFRLPSVNHQESVYAYHFYRLLQRAENVVLTYNSNSDGLRSGEMSRFLIQMMYDPGLKPTVEGVNLEIRSHLRPDQKVGRTAGHLDQLKAYFVSGERPGILSPSAINMWLNCRMRFFYRYVNGLKEVPDIKPDLDASVLGEILHEVMHSLFADYRGMVLNRDDISAIKSDSQRIRSIVKKSFSERPGFNAGDHMSGNEIIVSEVVMVYVDRMLNTDLRFAPLKITDLEQRESFKLEIRSGEETCLINVGGIIDRIDECAEITRVVDYKTGTVSDSISSVKDLFADDRKKDHDGWLQTMLYCEALMRNRHIDSVRPSIYRTRKEGEGVVSDKLKIRSDSKSEYFLENYSAVREEFLSGLTVVVNLIFSDDEPFVMTSDQNRKCRYCPYRKLCNR